jgi:hypothetical protein
MVRTYPPLRKRRPLPATRGIIYVPLLVFLAMSGCASLQSPAPIGTPSPLACYGAKRTREAWEELVRKYVDDMMAAQEAYSCQPPALPEPVPPPVSEALATEDCVR